jgi:hypothetical protein
MQALERDGCLLLGIYRGLPKWWWKGWKGRPAEQFWNVPEPVMSI